MFTHHTRDPIHQICSHAKGINSISSQRPAPIRRLLVLSPSPEVRQQQIMTGTSCGLIASNRKPVPQGAQNQTQMPVRQLVDDGLKNYWKDLAAPQGFEPRYADPESAVLPLNEGAVNGWNKT